MKRLLIVLAVSSLYATHIPTDYPTIEAALNAGQTHLQLAPGTYTLSSSSDELTLEAETTSYQGRYFGHLVGIMQQGPYELKTNGSTITVEPTSLEVPGKGIANGQVPSFNEVDPTLDTLLVYHYTEISEHEIIQAHGAMITLADEVTFAPGEGFMIKPRVTVNVEEATVGRCQLRGIYLTGESLEVGQALLVDCVVAARLKAAAVNSLRVVYLNGLSVTHTLEGSDQTYLGTGLMLSGNKYARSANNCFIGCTKGIDLGMYAHLVAPDTECFGCTTAIWGDGGSHVGLSVCVIRSCDRGIRLSSQSSCVSDLLAITDVPMGMRVLFNSQIHAGSLYLHDVQTHASVDDQTLQELMPPFQQGVRTLDPDGYGSYLSGISYEYLTSNTHHEKVTRDVPRNDSFLDTLPSEPFTKSYSTTPFVMPVQKRKGSCKIPKEKRCSRNCGKAPCNPCCPKKGTCSCKEYRKCAPCKSCC